MWICCSFIFFLSIPGVYISHKHGANVEYCVHVSWLFVVVCVYNFVTYLLLQVWTFRTSRYLWRMWSTCELITRCCLHLYFYCFFQVWTFCSGRVLLWSTCELIVCCLCLYSCYLVFLRCCVDLGWLFIVFCVCILIFSTPSVDILHS